MTATTKFYTGFFIVLALVVAISFYVGYRTGSNAERAEIVHRKAPAIAP
ncbi:MAG: hypothetical protein NVSMB21_23820 [Vulcanimicrobiaceae bacterium]